MFSKNRHTNIFVLGESEVEMTRLEARNEKRREWYAKNRDQINAKRREWNKKNKDKIRLYNARYWARMIAEAQEAETTQNA